MLQRANTDLFNPLVPKAHNREFQNLLLSLLIKSVKVSLRIFIICSLGFNGLRFYLKSQPLSQIILIKNAKNISFH